MPKSRHSCFPAAIQLPGRGWNLWVASVGEKGTGRREAKQFQLEVGSSGKGTRNSEVVQCFKGLRVHPAPDRRRCFRAFLRDHDGWIQITERGSSGRV